MAKAKETAAPVTEVNEKHDFEIRPPEFTVVQWHEERQVATGTKGVFSDRTRAEELVSKLTEAFPDRTYVIR